MLKFFSFFFGRQQDDLTALERALIKKLIELLPHHLAVKVEEQILQIRYIDRFDPKHYINFYPGKSGVRYSESSLFPLKKTECIIAEFQFNVSGENNIFTARFFAVRGALFSLNITPYFEKISNVSEVCVVEKQLFLKNIDPDFN